MLDTRQFFRQGPVHRPEGSSDFVAIRRQFDFRAIEIGRWVTPPSATTPLRCFMMRSAISC